MDYAIIISLFWLTLGGYFVIFIMIDKGILNNNDKKSSIKRWW